MDARQRVEYDDARARVQYDDRRTTLFPTPTRENVTPRLANEENAKRPKPEENTTQPMSHSRTVRLTDDLSYVPPAAPLPSWLKGFLVTSVHLNENAVVDAAIEASNILNDYWFKVAYDAHRIDGEKPYEKAECMWIPGCDSSAFIALRPDDNDVDVGLCARAIVQECQKGADWKQPTHVSRIVPVEKCASEFELNALASDVLARRFPPRDVDADPIAFAVRYEEHSAIRHFSSSDVNRIVAEHVPDVGYEVNLKTPKKTVLVVNAGGTMMMSVVDDYDALGHFNVRRAAFDDKPSDHVPTSDVR